MFQGTTGVLTEEVRNIKLGGKGGEGSQFIIESETVRQVESMDTV